MKRTKYDQERLLFRRQFVLGPRFLDGFPSWTRIDLPSGLHLTVHPDLPISRASGSDDSITLLGYILDPYHPEDRDADIIQRLLKHLEEGGTRGTLIRLTYPLGGRWILLVIAGQERWLFHDACGHRQIFYTDAPRPFWCATQPGILAKVMGLSMNRDTLRYYRTYRRKDPQYSWPGDTSPYPGIRRLQPNHLLDLRTRAVIRYWPEGDLTPRSIDEVVAENAQLLRGIIESASLRFRLSLGITGGRDTRTVLAASKSIRNQLYCFTFIWGNMNWKSKDIRVPSNLLTELRLPHHVIVCPPRMEKEFELIFRTNVTTAHDCYGPIVQGLAQGHPQERVCMLGLSLPILRVPTRRRLRHWRPLTDLENIDAETLAWCTYRADPFSHAAIRRWLSDVPRTNIHILDLFYWEEREGSWEAMTLAEWDLAQDSFAPCNSRLFLTNGLSVPESDRGEPRFSFHESLMQHMWPEVLSAPFNPPEELDILSTVLTSLSQLREKIDRKSPPSMGSPAVRAFQRHPWLASLGRIRWRATGSTIPHRDIRPQRRRTER